MADRGCLSVHDRRQLLKWNPNSEKKELHLLYSFNRDGARASTFHDKCDHKGPTYTVLYSPCGSVYGGYTSESWERGNVYKADATAFLFSLSFKNGRNDLKFPVMNTQKAIYCYDYYGPTFGNGYHWIPLFWKGYDMFTFKGELTKHKATYTLNGYFKFGYTYDMLNKRTNDVTNGSKTVSNLEVYGIRDIADSLPWRSMPPMIEELLEQLRTEAELFYPCNRQVEKAKILLFGQRCAGKSSFVNNVHSAFKQRRAQRAITGSANVKATIKFKKYSFTGRTGQELRFQLCDMPGLEKNAGPYAEDISQVLDGCVENGYTFKPGERISSAPEENDAEPPQLNDQIHSVCFVIDGTTVNDTDWKDTKEILEVIRQKGVPLMILLTKMDEIIPGLGPDMSLIFKSSVVEQLVHQVAKMFDVQHYQILPTKNYEKETDVLEAVHALTLFNVKQMLITTKDFMVNDTLPDDLVITMYKREERQQLSESELSDA